MINHKHRRLQNHLITAEYMDQIYFIFYLQLEYFALKMQGTMGFIQCFKFYLQKWFALCNILRRLLGHQYIWYLSNAMVFIFNITQRYFVYFQELQYSIRFKFSSELQHKIHIQLQSTNSQSSNFRQKRECGNVPLLKFFNSSLINNYCILSNFSSNQ